MYDHLELSVQPFAVHVTRQLYSRIYKYLFPEPKKQEHDNFEAAFKRVKALSAPSPETVKIVGDGVAAHQLSMNRKAQHLAPLDVSSMTASPARHSKRKWMWSGDERDDGTDDGRVDGAHAAEDGISAPTTSEPRGIDHKIVVLRHFRIHPLHMNVTYEGKAAALHDSHIVLDAFSYEDFRGRWRDLTSELKSHLVWSVLKSFTGFRGRYVESKIDDQAIIESTTKRKKRQQSEIEDDSVREFASEVSFVDAGAVAGDDADAREARENNDDGNAAAATDDAAAMPPRAIKNGASTAAPPLDDVKKPRRIRPVKNMKKLFKLGKYADDARRGARDDVLDAWRSAPPGE